MKNLKNLTRNILIGTLAVIIISIPASANTRNITASNPAALHFGVALMVGDLGGSYNGVGNSYTSGFRWVDWDDLHPGVGPNQRSEYYNVVSPRGVILNPVQETFANPPLAFSTTNFSLHNDFEFQPYSGNTIFSPFALNYLDVTFRIPGTKIPASVNGFGVILLDVDRVGQTWICLYDEAGRLMDTLLPQAMDNGLTLIGKTYSDGRRISRVSMRLGSKHMAASNLGCDDTLVECDKVAMDNIIYGEPRAMGHHPSDFDGDGGADYAVYRPSEGNWYVMQSGSNTFQVLQFGLNGDIPADGDFDGDSRSDMTVFRPSDGTWYSLRSSDGQSRQMQFGAAGDKPVAKDYDKDGKTDFAVWRPSDGNYYVARSSDNQVQIAHWGANGDIPIGLGGF